VVLRAARQGVDEGFCCLAAEQTAGRGRQGRTWVAPPGSALLASVLLRRSAAVAAGIPFAAGLALIDVLHRWGVSAALKWPNDVLVDRRKLAGILSEVEPTASIGDRLAIALGVGVNLSVDSFPPGIEAVSLHTLVARQPSAEDLLESWGDALRAHIARLERGGIGAILDDWRRCAAGLGGWVTVNGPGGTIDGVAVGVADDGALLVEASGQTHRFLAGDVHLGTQPG
jgi:BirA family biotin operon repressor/biotin-[acetyl-CoA-carboxylase] ligase